MPRPSGNSLRNIKPFVRSVSFSAISTVNAWTPVLLAISSVCRPPAPTGPAATKNPNRTRAVNRKAHMRSPLRVRMTSGNGKIAGTSQDQCEANPIGPPSG